MKNYNRANEARPDRCNGSTVSGESVMAKRITDADLRSAIDEEGLRYALINYYGLQDAERRSQIVSRKTRRLVGRVTKAIEDLEEHLVT